MFVWCNECNECGECRLYILKAGLGIRLSNFGANRLLFAKKSEQMSDSLKRWVIHSKSERFAHSLTSLRRNEWIFCFLKTVKTYQKYEFFDFLSESLIFCERKWTMIDLLKNRAIRWQSLSCPERPERILYIHSFVLTDLSEWANERIPNTVKKHILWQMQHEISAPWLLKMF